MRWSGAGSACCSSRSPASRSSARPASSTRSRALVEDARPDVLLLDVHMRGGASLDLIPGLAASTSVLVLTMQDDPGYARTAMRAGARGYVLKEAEDAELVQAVRTVAARRDLPRPGARREVLAAATATHRAGAHRTRARGARPDRARPHERRDGEAALPEPAHGRDAPREHPPQARHRQPRRARAPRARAGPGQAVTDATRGSRLETLALEGAQRRVRHDLAATLGGAGQPRTAWAVVALALALFMAGFALRLSVDDPGALIANTYTVPIALLAMVYGVRAGLAAAAFALLLVWAWGEFQSRRARPARLLHARRRLPARRRAGRLLLGAAQARHRRAAAGGGGARDPRATTWPCRTPS